MSYVSFYRYGNEDDLVTLFGVMQALVSVVLDSDDEIQSIHTSSTHFTFLHRENLLLVSVSQIPTNAEITSRQLMYVRMKNILLITPLLSEYLFICSHSTDTSIIKLLAFLRYLS